MPKSDEESKLKAEVRKLQTKLNIAYNDKREAQRIIDSNEEGKAGGSELDLENANKEIETLEEKIQVIESGLKKIADRKKLATMPHQEIELQGRALGGKLRKKKCTKKRCSKRRYTKKRHSKKRHNKKKRTRRRR